jgi:hypothetical protein
MVQGSLELNELDHGRPNDAVEQEYAPNDRPVLRHTSSGRALPPVDRGKEAWLFIAACWAVEAFVFGGRLLF